MPQHQLEHQQVELSGSKYPLILWAVDIELPDNVGSLFRLADALGLQEMKLVGSTPYPPHKKIERVSRQTTRSVKWEYFTYQEALNNISNSFHLHEDSDTSHDHSGNTAPVILGMEITSNSIDLSELDLPKKLDKDTEIHLLLGNEKKGLPQKWIDLCHQCVHVPMQGQNSSMNVAMATGIVAYQLIQKL